MPIITNQVRRVTFLFAILELELRADLEHPRRQYVGRPQPRRRHIIVGAERAVLREHPCADTPLQSGWFRRRL